MRLRAFFFCLTYLLIGLMSVCLPQPVRASVPKLKVTKTLALGDKLTIKRNQCSLQIKSQSGSKIVFRCVSINTHGVARSPATKSTLTLQAGDKAVIKANACRLIVNSATVSKSVVSCAALEWLGVVNSYRDMANLPHVSENAAWSSGNVLHARYMVKNNFIGHTEDPNNAWYTPEGKAAAENSDLLVSSSASLSDRSAIDGWMGAPFHAVGIIDPALGMVGFGSYHEADGGYQTGAGLDVLRGLGSVPGSVTFPVKWPSHNKVVALTAYGGNENPNPLTGCAGYAAPTGLPIILQIGPGNLTPNVTAHSFQQGAASLTHCIFDETNYTNPDGGQQSLVRSVLNARDAIILIPRNPLEPGKTYTVSITANGNTYAWSFAVASGAPTTQSADLWRVR